MNKSVCNKYCDLFEELGKEFWHCIDDAAYARHLIVA